MTQRISVGSRVVVLAPKNPKHPRRGCEGVVLDHRVSKNKHGNSLWARVRFDSGEEANVEMRDLRKTLGVNLDNAIDTVFSEQSEPGDGDAR